MPDKEADDLAARMVTVLQAAPCRSRDLFRSVEVDDRRGRDVLSALIDDGRVVVETDWTLHIRTS